MIKNTTWFQEKLQYTILFESYDLWNLDKGGSCGTLTNLSKIFDYIIHGFLISKLDVYGFIHEPLNVMKKPLLDKTHRTRTRIIVAANFLIY